MNLRTRFHALLVCGLLATALANWAACKADKAPDRHGAATERIEALERQQEQMGRELAQLRAAVAQLESSRTKRPDSSHIVERHQPNAARPGNVPGPGACLDEVGCLLADKPPECCSKYSGSGLNSEQIRATVRKHSAQLALCSNRDGDAGAATVRAEIAADGSVDTVQIDDNPDVKVQTCIKRVFKSMRFPAADRATRLRFPLQF